MITLSGVGLCTLAPRCSRIWIQVFTSEISGTFVRVTSFSVRMDAARHGSTAFLFPATVISPLRGLPPWMVSLDMCVVYYVWWYFGRFVWVCPETW